MPRHLRIEKVLCPEHQPWRYILPCSLSSYDIVRHGAAYGLGLYLIYSLRPSGVCCVGFLVDLRLEGSST